MFVGQFQRIQSGVQALERTACVVQVRVAEIKGAAVVGAQHQKPNGFAIVTFKHITDRKKIAQRLRHFLIVNVQEAVVHPVIHIGLAAGPFALGDFVLMVWKLQIEAPAVDIEMLTQQSATHRGALDVPARPSWAVGTGPFGVFGFVSFG